MQDTGSLWSRIGPPILVFACLTVLWEVGVRLGNIEAFLLPPPSAIAANLLQVLPATAMPPETRVWFSLPGGTWHVAVGPKLRPILQAGLYTLGEAMGGLLAGTVLGILMALLTAHWTAGRKAIMPFAIAANSMPIIAFAPIMNAWFGFDRPQSKMAIVAILVFFPILINSVRGLTGVAAADLALMRSYAASEAAILRRLRIPHALPYFFNGFKVATALSMIGAIVGEYFSGRRISLGVYITQTASLFDFAGAWAGIVFACLIGIVLYGIVVLLERWCIPWHVSLRSRE